MRFYPLGGGRIKECVLLPGGKISFSEIDLGVKEILLPGGKISFSEIDLGVKSHSRKLTYNVTHSLILPHPLLGWMGSPSHA